MKESIWMGFRRIDFTFEDREAILILPKETDDGKWLYKTEYFGAFPDFEIEMVKNGWHLAYLQNKSRWCLPEDIDIKARFCDYLHEKFGLQVKCIPVGMSCGGMHGVYFAAKYPQYIAGLYLDAPVMNLLSCPCGIGDAQGGMYEEFYSHTGMTKSQLINYRNHPVDHIDALIAHKIPVFLVCGDSDRVVPYHENGAILKEKYDKAGLPIQFVLKPGCDHHPHSLADVQPLVDFAQHCYEEK